MTFAEHLTQATDITLNFTQVIKINFQPDDFAVPEGYIKDSGKPYSEAHGFGFGWVREDSLDNEIATPLDIRKNARDRKQAGIDPQLNTLLHMQYPPSSSSSRGVKVAAAWQCTIPNGTYNVTVSVGDATASDSVHQINIQGEPVITRFVHSETRKFFATTKLVTVTNGKLTIDAKGGQNTKINYVVIAPGNRPAIMTTTPAVNCETGVNFITLSATFTKPNGGITGEALAKPGTVKLLDLSKNPPEKVEDVELTTSGGGDVINLTPRKPLVVGTKYAFVVTDSLVDINEAAFLPFSMTFTAGLSDESPLTFFEQVPLSDVSSNLYTGVVLGPDGKLYAGTLLGEILRFNIEADGTLSSPQSITSLRNANGGSQRALIGMCFDPNSTADNLILWVSHSGPALTAEWKEVTDAADWQGKISRLSDPDLETVQDYVINLPRSNRDHLTNSIVFKPSEPNKPAENLLYVSQGSHSAMGAWDKAWKRDEQLLTAAVLRVDLEKITAPPLDVKTAEGGSYDPFAADAPLTIYATGVRNAYDLVWCSNGELYAPTNGSAAGGNTPAMPIPLPDAQNRIDKDIHGKYTGPSVKGLTDVGDRHDFLFRIVKGGYYGHPNPTRCEWILDGGNPTGKNDPAEVSTYPAGTQPDRNWRGYAYDFGLHCSPNGAIEYKSNVLDGKLKGKLLVASFVAGQIIVLTISASNPDTVDSMKDDQGQRIVIKGFTGPLDLVENPDNGYLYVAQFDRKTHKGSITLLRPNSQS